MEETRLRRMYTRANLLEDASESEDSADFDDNDNSETPDRPLLRKKTTRTDIPLYIKTLLTLLAILFAASILIAILYFIGVGPWHLTHSRVTYGRSRYATFNCWNTSTISIFVPWDNGSSIQNQTQKFAKDNGKKYVESRAYELNDSTIDDLLNRTWEIYNHEFLGDGVICWIRILHQKERRTVRCNWIHPDRGMPEWHCNMACRPLMLLPLQGYWDDEVIYSAPHRSSGCKTWLPKGEFWGDYHLNCEEEVVDTSTLFKKRNTSTGVRTKPTGRPITLVWNNITAFLINLGPTRFVHQLDQQECYRTKFSLLSSCLWNKYFRCLDQNHIALALKEYWSISWVRASAVHTEIETWLNDSFPWTSVAKDQMYFRGDFPEGVVRSPAGLKGPYVADIRTQPLPTPDDLLRAPKDHFAKIDKCVARRIFDSLNDTDWVKTMSSPRCDLWQTSNTFYSTWKYHCPDPETFPTAKMVLRAWYEDYHRAWDWEWWGLQQEELQAWVIPCLNESNNYWIKYQYIATVYSKDRMIWPGIFWRPDNYVVPRPWRMVCTRNNTECTIGLARKPCQNIRGWEDHCTEHYADEYNTHASEVVWRKIQGNWRRAIVSGKTCTDAILGYHLQKRKSILDLPVPFIPDTLIALAEGHAFRKSLCEGEVDPGFDWVGPNLLYSNLTCNVSKEVWQKCGEGKHQHDCRWYETLGSTLVTSISDVVEEVTNVVGGGLTIIEHWLLNALSMLWPYLLGILGVVIAMVLGKVVLEVWLKALCRCKGRDHKPLPPKEEPDSA